MITFWENPCIIEKSHSLQESLVLGTLPVFLMSLPCIGDTPCILEDSPPVFTIILGQEGVGGAAGVAVNLHPATP